MTLTALAALCLAGALVLALLFRMRAAALATFAGLAAATYLVASDWLFLAFVLSFVLIALAKLVAHLAFGWSDVARWRPANFLYSAGSPVAAAAIAYFQGSRTPWELAALAGLAVVVSDNASAEVGTAMRASSYLITSFRRVPPGTDGAISLPGSVAGLAWSAAFALVVRLLQPALSTGAVLSIAGLGVLGNLADSLLGATLQRRGRLTNEQVNGASVTLTMIVALAAAFL